MSDSDSDSDQGAQVRVSLKLATSVSDRSLEVPKEPIAVPADIGRKGLSAVLNHLLGRQVADDNREADEDDSDEEEDDSEKLAPLNFEFILDGTNNRLLRKGVEKEARQNGVSLEEAISITYFPANNVPDLSEEKEELPDWVSSVSINESILCSGCYDGSLHLYRLANDGLDKIKSLNVTSGPIKSVATAQIDNKLWIASAALDHTLHLQTYSELDGLETYGQCVQDGTSCQMSALGFSSAPSKLLASGDANGAICIWDVTKGEQVTSSKKQKTPSGRKSSQHHVHPKIAMASAHSQAVSGLSWGNHNPENDTHLISGSWDHSLKVWDVEKQDCLLTLNGSRVVSCLDTSYHSDGVVATGHPDCTIRLWDVRTDASEQATVIADTTFRPSHKAWVSSVQWSKSNAYQLASASHDGTVKMWDIRSSNPLHTVRAFPSDEKALCLAWDSKSEGSDALFAGGTDSIVKYIKL